MRATSGKSAALDQRVGRGLAGAAPRSCLRTPSAGRPIGCNVGHDRPFVHRVGKWRRRLAGRPRGRRPTGHARYEWQISRSRPTGRAWSSWGSASVVSRYTERQTAYKRNDSGTTAPAFSSTASGTPYGWSSSQPSPTSSNRYVWQISRSRPRVGRGLVGVVPPLCLDTPSGRPPINATTPARRPRRSAAQPVARLMAGHRRRRVLRPAIATCGASVGRGRAGGSWSSWGSATVISTYTERQTAFRLQRRARPPLRLASVPVGCRPAGHRRSRRPTRTHATCGDQYEADGWIVV